MGTLRNIKTVLFILICVFAVYGAYTLYQITYAPSSTNKDIAPAAVLKSVRSLARLETVTYTIEKIIDISATEPQSVVKDFLFGDRLLLIATGDVVAGIDLQNVQQNDIELVDGHVTLRLPAPEILNVILNEPQTRVYDRKTGILSRPRDNLESEARKKAIEQIRESACGGRILDKATENAVNLIVRLLPHIQITTQTARCK